MRRVRVNERKLGKHKASGLAWPDGRIEIDPRQGPKEYLGTLVHELLHQAFPELKEDRIAGAEKLIAKHLWAENFRKVSQ